ncbi:MAG TPA: aminodeoxychorismate synthase component I [Candidatus Hydrogenedentes bacterium]|nr:aminodeoxychorismate synthase component I [Candidatus Hydrogenedentota bacterium]HPG70202.1 aminodeoxychorismate synthase component I [Candidatus Hydrogenedentota bacterium]
MRRFDDPERIVSASTLGEVRDCLASVESAVSGGLMAAGFITYEAASGLHSELVTQKATELPLACFGLFRKCSDTAAMAEGTGAMDLGPWQAAVSREEYLNGVNRIRSLIAAGDTYQVNYTFPLRARFAGDPVGWFRRLVDAQPTEYGAYLDFGRFKVLSVSPELFFRLDGRRLTTRPMKGTRPRGRFREEDERLRRELLASEKERAENAMIVDLLRNDMGRVSETGSVCVSDLFTAEPYPTVWQMTSTITSETKASFGDIVAALFPSGSVTGAPKVRTMQIIGELEPAPRGVYCGAVGWLMPGRQAQFNVAIRTVLIDTLKGAASYHVGSGITWDSEASAEYEECMAKARVLDACGAEFELVESLRYDGGYFLLDEHVDRMRWSAERLGFRFEQNTIRSALGAAPLGSHPQKVRLLLHRTGACRTETQPIEPIGEWRVGLAREPIDTNDLFLYHKTTARAVYAQLKSGRPDCDDVILWNRRGEVTESTIANVVAELDGKRVTPPVACGLLPGTMRADLLRSGEICERVVPMAGLTRATRIWLVNSVRKWIPVTFVP